MTTSPWPYPSYGDRGPDRALAAVVRSLRAAVQEAGDPVREDPESLLAALSHLAAIAERVDWAMLSVVGEARAHGIPWVGIGGSLGVTKQAAQQRFAPYVKEAMAQAKT
jgi:hypothetical protein